MIDHTSKMLPKTKCEVTERILNLTFEIIYLLTGEDYTVVKKTSDECVAPNSNAYMSGGWSRIQSLNTELPPHSLIPERNNEQKILDLTNKIIELLTREVPIRCQDVAVYFSMEEWEYIEGQKDRYTEVMMENHQVLPDPSDSIYTAAGAHGPVFPMCNSGKRPKDDPKTVELTSCNMGSLKEPNIPFPYTPTEHEQQCPSPPVKEEPVPCDGLNLQDRQTSTPPDPTLQYLCLQIKEEPLSCDERPLPNADPNHLPNNVTAPHNNRRSVQIKKAEPIEVIIRPYPTGKDNGEMVRDLENAIPLERNPASDVNTENQEQKLKTFMCPKCNKDFSNKQLLVLHQRTHMREKPFLCSKCGKSFSKISHYIRHQSVHIGMKPYTCPDCGKSFSDRSYLSRHQRMHADLVSKPFKCPECEIRFMNQYELVAHCKIHTGKKPFECSECGKRFTRNYQLLKHEKVHTGDVPFLCSQCGTCFRNNALLVKHQQYHSKEKQFSCSECGKSFSDRSHFVRHVRIHTGEKPFVCSECGRRFNDKSSLSRHHRLHTGEKPYSCSECGQSFRYSSSLLKHQEVHSISKPFKCPECDTYFMSNSELLMHCSLHSTGK